MTQKKHKKIINNGLGVYVCPKCNHTGEVPCETLPTKEANPPEVVFFCETCGEKLKVIVCLGCGYVSCVCKVRADHKEDCRYRIAAQCPVELECKHGAQACPICDPCTCEHKRLLQ